jgi:catechol 2,3-dioxygenase-like lactoylglutathione lyase family enzyme
MATVSVRYIVDDVDAAIDFYIRRLDFTEVMHPAPTFAMLRQADPARRSIRQSSRALRTDPAGSLAVGSHVTRDW